MIAFELFARLFARLLGLIECFPGPRGTTVCRVRRLVPAWAGAQTWGRLILVAQGEDWRAHWPHEYVHVLQWKRWRLFFPVAYALASLWVWIRGGRPYLDNPFEREARRRAAEFSAFAKDA